MNEYSYFTLDTFCPFLVRLKSFIIKNAWSKLWEDITEGEIKQNFQIGMWKKQF